MYLLVSRPLLTEYNTPPRRVDRRMLYCSTTAMILLEIVIMGTYLISLGVGGVWSVEIQREGAQWTM